VNKDWVKLSFSDLEGWEADDHVAALSCLRMSAKALEDKAYVSRLGVPPSPTLLSIAEKSLSFDMTSVSSLQARKFFENNFTPYNHKNNKGFVTAYFEPEVPASRTKSDKFPYPLYARPHDLVRLNDENRTDGFDPELQYARETENGLVEFYDRPQIDKGALDGRGLELFWLSSDVEGFYIHVQGSARLLLDDGTSARVSFAGKSGHAYSSIGKIMVKHGMIALEDANMVNIRKWLEEDPKRGTAMLHENRSFIFFTELGGHDPDFGPIAAAGVQLTPGRSLAVDKSEHAYGTPVWLSTHTPLPSDTKPYQRLMIAQDTGSAIVGPQRGDIFIGSGKEAGILAGSVRHDTDFIVLKPNA